MVDCIFDSVIFDIEIFDVCGDVELVFVDVAGNKLQVWHDGFIENRELVRSETYGWDATLQKVVRKVKPLGCVRTWSLRCFEENVDWDSSVVKTLQGMVDDNTSVAFVVSYGTLHHVDTNVKVLAVYPEYPPGSNVGTRQRNFTVTLQEVA